MKKLVLALSFVFVLGLIAVNAQDQKKQVKKAPAKTEAPAAKVAKPAAAPAAKKAEAPAPKKAKKGPKKVAAAPVKK